MQEKVIAILLAAGRGSRMNSTVKKQFMELKDKPLLYYSLKAFEESSVDEVILVTDPEDMEFCQKNIIEPNAITKVTKMVQGGNERFRSVLEGLKVCGNCGYVLIHDSARPFVSKELIEEVITEVKKHRAVLPAVPTKDTVKVVNVRGEVEDTPARTSIYLAQTPQAFAMEEIMRANAKMMAKPIPGLKVTDDAMIVEHYGSCKVHVVMGDYDNIKVTTPSDVPLAMSILERRKF